VRRRLLLLALPVLSACADWADDVAGPAVQNLAAPVAAAQGSVADRYIIVFRNDVQDPDALSNALAAQFGGTVHFRYAHAIKGFAATLPASSIAGISRNPNVSYIEPDGLVAASGTDFTVSSWGLDRIDQRDLPLSNSYTWNSDGSNVRAYIIDTGIRTTHSAFGGRASVGYDALGGNGQDCNGHGTHVAGTVGGAEYGVARNVTLVAVRVLDCGGSGTTAGVIAGVNWVTANAQKPAVANMSLGGGLSSSLNQAVTNAVSSGVTFAVAAGNSNANACNYSPASAGSALTVGATTITDARASYSNYGTCVDLFAPGSSITSSWNNSDTGTNTISGTSMASPHVAGVAALYLSTSGNSNATPGQVETAVEGAATVGKVTSPGTGSPNLLLYNVFGGSPPPPSGFTLTARGYKVKGYNTVDLSWSGASTNVDIYRDGALRVTNSPNDGSHTDALNVKGGGTSYTYKVCNTGTQTCSNNITVNF
jgi:subtilisin family serine protease